MKTNRRNFLSIEMGEDRRMEEERSGEGRKNTAFFPLKIKTTLKYFLGKKKPGFSQEIPEKPYVHSMANLCKFLFLKGKG